MRKYNKIALLLCLSMVFTNPAVAYAEQSISQDAISGNEGISDNDTTSSDSIIGEAVPDAAEMVSGDEAGVGYGFQEMELTQSMIDEKASMGETVAEMAEMVPGKDYVEHSAVFFADSIESAKKIADCYNGQVVYFEYGVAEIKFDETTEQVIKMAADTQNSLPAVYPNIIYKIHEESTTVSGENLDPVFHSEGESNVGGLPTDPMYGVQWAHEFTDDYDAWDLSAKGDGVVVAVLDTGVDMDHEDLMTNLLPGISTVTGYTTVEDGNGHGSHVSGIIAGVENSVGGVGIAPKAKILPIKVLGDDGYSVGSSVLAGINAAIQSGEEPDVINMSLGSLFYDELEKQAITKAVDAGITVVCSAGNDGSKYKNYPGAYSDAISVAALAKNVDGYGLASYSNYADTVDIAAPGSDIYSSVKNNGYDYYDGTSMASPVVAGAAALVIASNKTQLHNNRSRSTVTKVRNYLLSTAKDETYSYGYFAQMHGGVDIAAAVATAAGVVLPAPSITPEKLLGNGKVQSGETYHMTMSVSNNSAKIYYTYNGKKPSKSTGYLYTGTFNRPITGKYTFKAVAVLGEISSPVTVKAFDFEAKTEQVKVEGGTNQGIVAGKSVLLKPVFVPTYTTVQKVNWISNNTKVTVSDKGVVKCDKTAQNGDKAVITGTTTDGSNVTVSVNFTVAAPVTSITLSSNSLMLTLKETTGTTAMNVFGTHNLAKDVSSNGIMKNYTFSSSNKKAAVVDENGLITAVGKGKTVITVKANDGSNKSVKCNVTVILPVYDINTLKSDTGYFEKSTGVPIGIGGKVKIAAYLNDDNRWAKPKSSVSEVPSNQKIIWTSSNPAVVVKNGVVTCSKTATAGQTAVITATAADGFGEKETMTFTTYGKLESIKIVKNGRAYTSFPVTGTQGVYDAAQLTDLIQVTGNGCCTYMRGTSSNTDIVRYSNSKFILCKPGTAKITFVSEDGSGKNVSFVFKVK